MAKFGAPIRKDFLFAEDYINLNHGILQSTCDSRSSDSSWILILGSIMLIRLKAHLVPFHEW